MNFVVGSLWKTGQNLSVSDTFLCPPITFFLVQIQLWNLHMGKRWVHATCFYTFRLHSYSCKKGKKIKIWRDFSSLSNLTSIVPTPCLLARTCHADTAVSTVLNTTHIDNNTKTTHNECKLGSSYMHSTLHVRQRVIYRLLCCQCQYWSTVTPLKRCIILIAIQFCYTPKTVLRCL